MSWADEFCSSSITYENTEFLASKVRCAKFQLVLDQKSSRIISTLSRERFALCMLRMFGAVSLSAVEDIFNALTVSSILLSFLIDFILIILFMV